MSRYLRALAAATSLTGFLIGLPIVLADQGMPFVGQRWPTLANVLAGASIPDSALLDAGVVALWVAWALVGAGVVAEVSSWRGRRPRLTIGRLQPVLARLVASVVMVLPVAPRLGPTPVLAHEVAVVTAEAPPAASPAPQLVAADLPTERTYWTKRGDSWWRIAAEQLGDGRRWAELRALNAERLAPLTTDPDFICSGWSILMPQDWAAPADVAPAVAPAPPADEAPTVPTTPPPVPVRSVPAAAPLVEPSRQPDTVSRRQDSAAPPVVVALGAGGGLAGVLALRRRHRGALARRPSVESTVESTELVVDEASLAGGGRHQVRVLGPVEVLDDAGAPVAFERPKAEEMVVFLACQGHPVDRDQVLAALWPPDAPPSPHTLDNTASRVRAALGRDGLLGPPYRLAGVAADLVRFRALVAAEALAQALALVRGRPFDGVAAGAYTWALASLTYEVEAEIVDVAHRHARACLDAGDAPGARAAARAGLRASPFEERLYRDLMRAGHLSGGRAAVQLVLNEMAAVWETGDVDPLDVVDPETADLFEELALRESA